MEIFSIYFGLKLSFLIFAASEQFRISIQDKNTSVQNAYGASNATSQYFERQRRKPHFTCSIPQFVKRQRIQQKNQRFQDIDRYLEHWMRDPHLTELRLQRHNYRQQYFEALELAQGGLETRF